MTRQDPLSRASGAHEPIRPIRNATVLVIGASGAVGSAVARRLLADGIHVVALARDRARLAQLQAFGASSFQGDVRDPGCRDALQRVAGDAIGVLSFLPPRRDAVKAAARLMREMPGTYRIHLSSAAIYERGRDQYDLTERQTRPSGLSPCPFRSAERVFELVTQGCVTLIRPGRLYGPARLGAPVMRWASSGPLPLIRGGEVESSALSVDELAGAITHLLATPSAGRAFGPFNLASPVPFPVLLLVAKMVSDHTEGQLKAGDPAGAARDGGRARSGTRPRPVRARPGEPGAPPRLAPHARQLRVPTRDGLEAAVGDHGVPCPAGAGVRFRPHGIAKTF